MTKPAPAKLRFYAFSFDAVLFITVFFGFGRALWELVPGAEVPIQGMHLFNDHQAIVYLSTVFGAFITAAIYFAILPTTKFRGTIGQNLFGIRLVRPDGQALRLRHSVRILCVLFIKIGLIALLGPIFAFIGLDYFYRSRSDFIDSKFVPFMLLFFPLGLVFVASLISWSRPDGRWLWEKIGGYRYIKVTKE